MKKITKRLFILSVITSIITICAIVILQRQSVKETRNMVENQLERAQNIVDSTNEISDVEGYAALGHGIAGVFGIFGIIFIDIYFFIKIAIIIIASIMYMVSWLKCKKEDTKTDNRGILDLIIIGSILRTINMCLLAKCMSLTDIQNTEKKYLVITAIVSEVICVIGTIIYIILNRKQFKNITEKEDEKPVLTKADK